MNLTDFELESIYEVLHGEYFYGQELIYQEAAMAVAVGTGLEKIREEIKRRKLW